MLDLEEKVLRTSGQRRWKVQESKPKDPPRFGVGKIRVCPILRRQVGEYYKGNRSTLQKLTDYALDRAALDSAALNDCSGVLKASVLRYICGGHDITLRACPQ